MTLRVTVEIIPFGDETKARKITTLNISNVTFKEGRGPSGEDTYIVEVDQYKNYDENTKRVHHNRNDGAVSLVEKACRTVQ